MNADYNLVTEKAKATEKEVEAAKADAEAARRQSNVLCFGMQLNQIIKEGGSLSSRGLSDTEIEFMLNDQNTNSALFIDLARVYKRGGQIDRAIKTLKQLETRLEKQPTHPNRPAMMYNLACYYCLCANNDRTSPDYHAALNYLQKALEPSVDRDYLLKEMPNDEDLALMRAEGLQIEDPMYTDIAQHAAKG